MTAVLGVLYAVLQTDLKRVLAYSTIENIGIIFIGLGLALAFRANGMTAAAALALTAALFHAFNHSLFKSLLFLGAGAVLARDRAARHREARRPHPSNAENGARFPRRRASRSRRCRRSTASSRNG